MDNKMLTRSVDGNFQVSGDDNVPKLRGRAVPYNTLSVNPIVGVPREIKERILPGAFTRSLQSGSDVFMLWNHEMKYVLGRTSKATLRLTESSDGVNFENVPPPVGWAQDLTQQIKRGDVSSMSFGFFNNVEPKITREGAFQVQNVKDATLCEISVVTLPVFESTSIYARDSNLLLIGGELLDYISEKKQSEGKSLDDSFKEVMARYDAFREKEELGERYEALKEKVSKGFDSQAVINQARSFLNWYWLGKN